MKIGFYFPKMAVARMYVCRSTPTNVQKARSQPAVPCMHSSNKEVEKKTIVAKP